MNDKLKRLILYRERDARDRKMHWPSIEENMDFLDDAQKAKVLDYMDKATSLFDYVSPIEDPYNDDDMIPYGVSSDGTYIWDGVIEHWVSKYAIRLPTMFMDHINSFETDPNRFDSLDVADLMPKLKSAELVLMDEN